MRVAIITRSSLFSVRGGDTIQVVNTAEGLKKLGVEVDIFKASEKPEYDKYDLLHFFNIIRPADLLYHIRNSGKTYVLSTIYLDYSEFDRHGRSLFYRSIFKLMGKHRSEYLKNLYRYYKKQDHLSSREYLLGHKRAMKKAIRGAALLLPNSTSEYKRLEKDIGFSKPYLVVPNGIDAALFKTIPKNIKRENKVLCVAQVYGMKNQLLLIEACKKLKLPLEIIGKAPPNHTSYYDACRAIAGENVKFYDFMPQQELLNHYTAAKVHALPSWFETTGLSSMEAAAMGCNIVVGSGGDTREYFEDQAWYCTADNLHRIETAVAEAMESPESGILRKRILENFTWEKAAIKTFEGYNKVLNNA